MEQQQQDPFLFILLGFDTLYSINLNHLHLLKEEEADLEIMFSHRTHNKQPGFGNPYPIGMGLFVHDSKLHYFGGENIHVDDSFQNISFEMTEQPQEELNNHSSEFLNFLNFDEYWMNWNNKVFSFIPILSPILSLVRLLDAPVIIPSHLSNKTRPIVFTFSDKVYALSTRPFSGSLLDAGIMQEQDLFEVFEPDINGKWRWKKLPNPPPRLYIALSRSLPVFHCVIKNQLLLQTWGTGDFIFDLVMEEWLVIPYGDHDVCYADHHNILASLEYKEHLLLFYEDGNILACDLISSGINFEPYEEGVWRSSFGANSEKVIFSVESILDDYGSRIWGSRIWGASLSKVDDNSICLVLNCFMVLYVCHFECTMTPSCFRVGLKAYKKFHLPPVMSDDPHTLSSFILKGDVGKSNQDSTTGEW